MRRLWRRWLTLVKQLPLSDGDWSYSRPIRPEDPSQGWKLHVSATILSAAEVFARVQPVLRKTDVLFKVPCRLESLKSINSGLTGFSQIGKFLTVYSRSTDEFLKLTRVLHRATIGLPGPRIPFDAQYRNNSLVFYRYGAFSGSTDDKLGFVRAPGGKRYRDKRAPGKAIPGWLKDPFPKSRPNPIGHRLISRQLIVFKAKAQRGKGGVYEAIDLSVQPVRRVIVKEGRLHGETNWDGRDGYALVKHEAQVLREMRKAMLPVPEILRDFTHNKNRYLVLERITGRRLLPEDQMHPLNTSWQRAERILEKLEPILSKLHAVGWVWRDCKPSHIFWHRGTLRLIDFEGACRIGQTKIPSWGSPDYIPLRYHGKFSRRAGTFEDDYALGVIAFQFLSGQFPPNSPRHRASIYKATRCPVSLRKRIENLLQLSDPSSSTRDRRRDLDLSTNS